MKPALCCQDPEWLFRIYQDTIVDADVVVEKIRDALEERKRRMKVRRRKEDSHLPPSKNNYPHTLQPSKIRNVSCKFVTCPGVGMLDSGPFDSEDSEDSDENDQNLCAFLSFLPPLNWPHILDLDEKNDASSPFHSAFPSSSSGYSSSSAFTSSSSSSAFSSSSSLPSMYEVWFQPVDSTDGDSVLSFLISDNFRHFSKAKDGVDPEIDYYVWVRLVHRDLQGPFSAKPADCLSSL